MAGPKFEIHIALNQGAIRQLTMDPNGEVGRYIFRLAMRTAVEARSLAPRKTGNLRSNIEVHRAARNGAEITANVPYAMAVHQGVEAHDMRPKSGKVMKFPNRRGGGPSMVYAAVVHRKATVGNPFLVKALRHAITMSV